MSEIIILDQDDKDELLQEIDKIKVPTKTSQLENDNAFITKAVNDLVNYYLKSETYSKAEVDNKLSAIPKFTIKVVDSLPTANIDASTVYLLKSGEESQNLYTEYIHVNNAWECLGKQTVDLSGYALKADIPTKFSDLLNDSGFLTNTVTNLVNYYTKTESDNKYQAKGSYALKSEIPSVPVQSVNGKTGAVQLSASDVGARPSTWTPSKSDVGLGNVDNVKQYSASNPPPYPVTSVNGKTGAVTVSVPTKTSQLTNDSNYLTQHQDLSAYAKKATTLSGYGITDGATKAQVKQLSEEIVNQGNQVTTNKNDIVGIQKELDDLLSTKAEGDTLEEQLAWLAENGDTTKEYLCIDGYYYACVYTEGEPLYKNWLPLADTTTLATGDASATGSNGYFSGYRLNSSGLLKSANGYYSTGFIPYTYKGTDDYILIDDATTPAKTYTQELCFYDSSHTFLGYGGMGGTYDELIAHTDNGKIGGWLVEKKDDGTYSITWTPSKMTNISNGTIDTSKIAYFRLCTGDFANAIITINEEIIEGTTEGSYTWENTGRSNSSTNYEARIAAIEKKIEDGEIGGSFEITNIEESTEDGGENVVTFSDGKTLIVKNGSKGAKGANGTDGKDGTVQIEPLFAESVSWLNSNGDTSKLYILPNNYVYGYINGTWTNTGNKFVDTSESSVQKYLNDRNTYIAPVPSGFCESLNEYSDYSVQVNYSVDLETQLARFASLASSHPNYVTETLLGKDASNTYDIYKYELELNSPIGDGFSSVVNTNKPVFIITAGLHGIEHDAVDEVYFFMKDLCENYMDSDYFDYLRNNVKFVIVPISNPWGYVNLTYNNSNNVNLNKNFEHGFAKVTGATNVTLNTGENPYSEVETVLLKGVFDEYKDAVFHLECHGKASNDTEWGTILWFSNMASLKSELIEICSVRTIHQIGCRLHRLGFDIDDSECGWITYYTPNGRPKDYTGTEYGMLSTTMEGTGRMGVAGHTTYTKHEQKINCEALENFVLRVLDSLNSRVEI